MTLLHGCQSAHANKNHNVNGQANCTHTLGIAVNN